LHRALYRLGLGILVLFVGTGLGVYPVWADPFPQYEVIRPNVDFWIKVYTQYDSTQAIVHDSENLDIVYGVVDLVADTAAGSRKINRGRMKRAREFYRAVLARLAARPDSGDADAKRVRALFTPGAGTAVFQRARNRVRCQIGQQDRFQAGLVRSGAYIDQIRTIMLSYGLPEDLAYLPHVESSFNPEAYSKFGAAGIWQFTRSTGNLFMNVDYALDERRDPIRATYAAAELLKENHARLGSWPLAITAYNHGAAGLERAKRAHGDYPTIFRSYRSRTFKFASRNFYSEFLAAREVAANFETYFGPLEMAPPRPTTQLVLEGYVRFADLSDHFGVAPETLKLLNPALRPPVITGQKFVPRGYRLHLPPAIANDGLPLEDLPTALYHKAQKPSRFYTVQRGDTAGRIARTHGVALSDLILANNLNTRATIYPRQTLRIPLPGEAVNTVPAPAETEASVVLVAENRTPEAAAPPAATEPSAPLPAPASATPAEAAEPVAASVDAAPEPAAAPAEVATEVPPPILAAVVPLGAAEAPAEASAIPAAAPPSGEIVSLDVGFVRMTQVGRQPVGVLQVEVEETLGHYADWAGVRTQQIRRLNKLRFGQTLHLNQKVKIPLDNTTAEAFEALRYEYHKRLQEDFFAVYKVSELERYRIARGDNYWSLARDKFEVPMWLLKHYNQETDLADLRPGQELMVPVIERSEAGDPGAVVDEQEGLEPDEDQGRP
jgi:membrane-bound lytic murein transglycosylase D